MFDPEEHTEEGPCKRCGALAPWNEILWIYVHDRCLDDWWDETGRDPDPIVIHGRDGYTKTVGVDSSSDTVDDENDPKKLRERGVIT